MQVFHPSSHWLRGTQVARKPTTHLQTVCASSNFKLQPTSTTRQESKPGPSVKQQSSPDSSPKVWCPTKHWEPNCLTRQSALITPHYPPYTQIQRYHMADLSPDWFLCLHAWGGGGSRDVMTSDKWHGEGLTFRKLILNWNSVSHGAQTFTEGWSLTSCPSALMSLSQRTNRLTLQPCVVTVCSS